MTPKNVKNRAIPANMSNVKPSELEYLIRVYGYSISKYEREAGFKQSYFKHYRLKEFMPVKFIRKFVDIVGEDIDLMSKHLDIYRDDEKARKEAYKLEIAKMNNSN